ncbi:MULTISPECIES: ABC transporter ATP-binding protein [unclassified Rhizobium]|uniref:ABC transporter ATP-binding protein n=1 Tax=unclassified Rhizobium TaxID=2613769 RepID=UPI00161CF2D0|nr:MULTISPECIES: ABC transporter ATP-binding protein [unclassified Rhizobium]MBB3320384.1 oligopeptide/dipeptide ABC transporter ATP-binding protein [Rhizobium sp. BK181]MCS4096249.1 oligopeptide/dipeptide ABC transporter ATP-binding protein [Rhizobium sp. BK176]
MSHLLLDVQDLDVRFGPVHAARGVSFHVAPGETLGVVGESGSGKSTTMLAVLGLNPKRQAQVSATRLAFDGEDLLAKSDQQMRDLRGRRVGLIFQDPLAALNPLMTVGRQIAEVLVRHRGLDKKAALEEAAKLLERTGVPDPRRRSGQFPHQFSGGMRQRVMIAIALAGRPDLLIADEPTTALDVTVQAEIVRLIRDIQQASGMGLVWITHDLALMARVADRVMVMYAGAVVEEAPVDRLYAAPRHPYTAGLLSSIARLDQPRGHRARAISGTPPTLTKPIEGCAFAPRCPLRFDKCTVAPPLLDLGDGVRAACWRLEGEQQ